MKKLPLLLTAVAGMYSASFAQVGTVPGCPGAFGPTKIVQGKQRADSTTSIGVNTTWVKDTIYIIKDLVRVGKGATLTLQAGTIVMGFPGPLDTSALIIKQGAKLNALGTSTNPVVLTSCKLQGTRSRGDWGGLVITGKAISNNGVNVQLEGNYGAYYGGTDNEDNSGTIQYTRVEFAGFAFEPNRELNGITLAGVGAKTVFQNVQVSYANDDSFEWFGGTVNSRNLISWKGLDDDFDTDNGFSGISQFGVAYRDYNVADFSGSNAFESDNDATGSANTPKTSAIFSNYEAWGPILTATAPYNKFFKTGAILRRNTEQDIYNSLFLGWPGDTTQTAGQGAEVSGVYINGAAAAANATSGAIRFKKNSVAAYNANPTAWSFDNDPTFNAQAWFATGAFANSGTNGLFSIIQQVKAPLRESPLFALNAGANLLTGSSFTTAGLSADLPIGFVFAATPAGRGFQNVAYRGSNAGSEWAEPWAEYNPILFKYTAGVVPTRQGAIDAFLNGNDGVSINSVVCSPNPAVASTIISFAMEYATTDAAVSVLDLSGNVVFSNNTEVTAGMNFIPVNTSSLNPGTYVVRVSANGAVAKTTKLSIAQ